MSNTYAFDFLRKEHTLDHESGQPHHRQEPADLQIVTNNATADAESKPFLEKQSDILNFLKAHRGSGCLAPNVIKKATGIDLDLTTNRNVVQNLQHNPKIRVELVPDPENPALMVATYAYQAKYSSVRDRASLLAQINRMTSGISQKDLLDAYANVAIDIKALIVAGDIIAVNNTEDKDRILFPRGEQFLVELDGLLSLPQITRTTTPSSSTADQPAPCAVTVDMDPRTQVRRGEAVQVGGQWCRVSSAVRDGSLEDQPPRAQAPLSVVSRADLSAKNEADGYVRPFSVKSLPLDRPLARAAQDNLIKAAEVREKILKLAHGRTGGMASQLFGSHAHASNPTTLAKSLTSSKASRKRPHTKSAGAGTKSLQQDAKDLTATRESLSQLATDPGLALYGHVRRHGCTKDVREMYLATRDAVPKEDADLRAKLIEHKLLGPGEKLRLARLKKVGTNVDNDGKPKKRRYYERKNQRMTNTHLEGTEIGAILARASEKQKQGKAVGDGGM